MNHDTTMPIPALIEKYKESMTIRNLSQNTINENSRHINKFFEYIEKEHDITAIDQITKDIIYDYQVYQYERINARGKLNSIAEQNKSLSCVKSFFRFLREYDYIISDPSKTLQYAKQPKRLPQGILTPSEVRKILHTPDVRTVTGYRDRTIMELFYTSGIRRSELINIKLSDVDYNDGFIRIDQGKGKKDRIVPIGKIACRYIENYIKSVRPELIKDPYNNYLFLSLKGNRISGANVYERVKMYAKKAKIKKNVYLHTFRHSCATGMLKNKADIRAIQELLGHESLNSTQIYTRVTITDLKEVHKQCHPREKDKE